MQELELPIDGFRFLLDQTGIETLVGMEPAHLPRLSEGDREAVRRSGLAVLQERGLAHIAAGSLAMDATLDQMWQVLSRPQIVVRATRRFRVEQEAHPIRTVSIWYFVSGSSIVELAGDKPGHYRLAVVTDKARMLDALAAFLPLSVSPPAAHYVANMTHADLLDLLSLRDVGGDIAAIDILRSDGLPVYVSRELFSDMRAPDWTGAISIMRCEQDKIVQTFGVLGLQAGTTGWMAHVTDPDQQEVRVETVLEGALRRLLADDLAQISTKAGRS